MINHLFDASPPESDPKRREVTLIEARRKDGLERPDFSGHADDNHALRALIWLHRDDPGWPERFAAGLRQRYGSEKADELMARLRRLVEK